MSEELVILRDETLKVALEKVKKISETARPCDLQTLSDLTSLIAVLGNLH